MHAYLDWYRISIEEVRSVKAWRVTAVTSPSIGRLGQAKAAHAMPQVVSDSFADLKMSQLIGKH